jgi:4-hydroxy-2-oxoheptanedioate aldolase
MVRVNKTKAKIKAGETVFGASISPHEAGMVELAGLLGFDYIMIDWEHYLFDARMIEDCIRTAELHDLTPLVRIEYSPERVQHLLNAGAQGLLVARVNGADEVRAILDESKFHPEGKRTVFWNGRGGQFGLTVAPGQAQQWTLESNREMMIGCIVEEITGVNNLPAILAFPEVDFIHLGPWDLAHSLAWPPQSEITAIAEKIVTSTNRASKTMSTTWTGVIDQWPEKVAAGYRMFTVSPRNYFKSGAAQFLKQAKEISAKKA